MHNSSTEAVNQAQEAGVIHDHIEDSHNTLTTNGFHSFAENEARNENSPPDGAQDSGTTNDTLQSSGSGVIVPRTPLATNHAQPDSTNEETPHNESSGEASHSATESSEIHCRPSSLALAQPVPIMGYPNQQHPSSCPTPQPHNSQLVHHHSVYSSSSPYSTSYTYNNSEPGTPASSSLGTSAGWLHSYNPYVSGFPAVDFNGLLWGASAWPFAAAASGHPLTPNDMVGSRLYSVM
ncbi:hypothetical protein Ddc_08768 [Ditylenchus destructor]|nr:hypothetical protein Ddc_08768 [Ditylenchus destructor]